MFLKLSQNNMFYMTKALLGYIENQGKVRKIFFLNLKLFFLMNWNATLIWCLLFHRNWKEKCNSFVIYLPYLSIYPGYNVRRRHISDFKNYVLICCNLAWFITLKWLIDTTPWLKSSRFTIWTFRKLISWGTYSNAVLQLQYTGGMRIWKY